MARVVGQAGGPSSPRIDGGPTLVPSASAEDGLKVAGYNKEWLLFIRMAEVYWLPD